MSSKPASEFEERALNAVRYFENEHGNVAIEQASMALTYALEINDMASVDVFTEVLKILQSKAEART